jgi:tetratricopeptide (TPR) repeat protein
LYKGGDIHDPFHNYPKAIEWYEKILKKDEAKEQELLKQGMDKHLQAIKATSNSLNKTNFTSLCNDYINLHFLHKVNGDTIKANEYWEKLNEKSDKIATAGVYMTNAMSILFLFEWNEDEDDFWKALAFQEKGIKQAEEALKEVSDKDKPLATLRYQYYLKALGASHRSVKNYEKAEAYLKQAIAYPVLEGPFTGKMKLMGSYSANHPKDGRYITLPLPIQAYPDGVYNYRIEANWEMFWLKYEQGKMEEAFEWLEKGFQVAVAEKGNDLSGEPLEIYITRGYPDLKGRFKVLKAKYFPPTEKK